MNGAAPAMARSGAARWSDTWTLDRACALFGGTPEAGREWLATLGTPEEVRRTATCRRAGAWDANDVEGCCAWDAVARLWGLP